VCANRCVDDAVRYAMCKRKIRHYIEIAHLRISQYFVPKQIVLRIARVGFGTNPLRLGSKSKRNEHVQCIRSGLWIIAILRMDINRSFQPFERFGRGMRQWYVSSLTRRLLTQSWLLALINLTRPPLPRFLSVNLMKKICENGHPSSWAVYWFIQNFAKVLTDP
jgi:hypothetical protein